ncbi:hypothetical protein JCM15519_08270 [Fundidesulfovibrio butyratiphilus]
MTDNKKSPFLLRAVIVAVALAVGAGLNIYFLRGSHEDRQVKPEPPRQEATTTSPAPETPSAMPGRDFNVASPFKNSTEGAGKPAEGAQTAQGAGATQQAAPEQPAASAEQPASAAGPASSPSATGTTPTPTDNANKGEAPTAVAQAPAAEAGQSQVQAQDAGQGAVQPAQGEQAPQPAAAEQVVPEKPLTKAQARAEARAKAKAAAAEKAKAAAEERAAKAKAAAEEKAAKAQAEAQRKAEAKAQAKAEAEAKAEKAKAAAKERAEARAKAKAEAAAKVQTGAPAEEASGQAQPQKREARREAASVPANKLVALKAEENANEFLLTLQCDAPVDNISHFATPNPARMVFDLGGAWRVATAMTQEVHGELVEQVRLGLHPDKLRLVLDFKNTELQRYPAPVIEKRENTVVIRLAKIKG